MIFNMLNHNQSEPRGQKEINLLQTVNEIKKQNTTQNSEVFNFHTSGQEKYSCISQLKNLDFETICSKEQNNYQNNNKAAKRPLSIISNMTRERFQIISNQFSIFKTISRKMETTTYTQNQVIMIAKGLVEGIISLEKVQTPQEKQMVDQLFDEENSGLIEKEQLFYFGMLEKLKERKIQPTPFTKSRIYHRMANIKKKTQIKSGWSNQFGIKCIKSNDYKVLNEAQIQQIVRYEAICQKIKQMVSEMHFQPQKVNIFEKDRTEQHIQNLNLAQTCFQNIFLRALQEKEQQIESLSIISDPILQSLMIGLFSIETMPMQKSLGKMIDLSLEDQNLSIIAKSVLLSHFFQLFSLPKDASLINYLSTEQKQQPYKIFMEQFFKEYYQIKQAFKYGNVNHRIYHRVLQFKQIKFQRNLLSMSMLLQSKFAVNIMIQSQCSQNIRRLREMLDFYFIFKRDRQDVIYDQFSMYYSWINYQLQRNNTLDQAMELKNQLLILKVQQLFQNNRISQAGQILQEAIKFFKSQEVHEKTIECEILLLQYLIKSSFISLQSSLAKFQEISENIKAFSIQLSGSLLADALLRISDFLLENIKGDEKQLLIQKFSKINQSYRTQNTSKYYKIREKQFHIFQHHRNKYQCQQGHIIQQNQQLIVQSISIGRMTIRQMSRSKGEEFIYALSKILNQYGPIRSWQSLILRNEKIYFIKLYNIGTIGCKYLAQAHWNNLIKLDLNCNAIGDNGCEYLIQADWKKLTKLSLGNNQIGANGCSHLSRGNWKNLTYLNLGYNDIGSDGCKHLVQAEWKYLTYLNLRGCRIRDYGCEHLIQADWSNLTHLLLGQNDIGDQGCRHLTNADWNNLTKLDLVNNRIGSSGCDQLRIKWNNLKYLHLQQNRIKLWSCHSLSKAMWNNISELNLNKNDIGSSGCDHLSKACWKNLTKLSLQNNSIRDNGCMHLSKADWKKLTQLDLGSNIIGADGCLHLSQADWKHLSDLSLSSNYIRANGCRYISEGDWSRLTKLNLCNNEIEAEGCRYLSRAKWDNLNQLDLGNNDIRREGCEYLAEGSWKNIAIVDLRNNNIGADGCMHLNRAGWINLTHLNLGRNNIGVDGCTHLSTSLWKNLTHLHLASNQIKDNGCKHLSDADWKNLTKLDLGLNGIGADGCLYLSQASWINLTQLDLGYNNIGAKGCKHLSSAVWKKLGQLNLQKNKIQSEGFANFSHADWKNLVRLDLRDNNLGDVGCYHLSKGNWKKLTHLNISCNNIGIEGFKYLGKANWKNFVQLNLCDRNISRMNRRLFFVNYAQKKLNIQI